MYCGRVKWLHRSDLAREPLCREPWYRQKSGDSTHHCWSPTPTLNGCDLPPSTRTQFSEQEYSYLTASKRHQSTPYSHNTHRSFHEEPGNIISILSRSRQNMSTLLWHAPSISQKFAEERNLFCCATAATKIPLDIIQLWFNYFRSIMAGTLPGRLSRDAAVLGPFTPVSLFVYRDDQFANLSVPFQNAMPLDTQPSGVISSPNSLSNFSQLVLSSDLAAASESLLMHSSMEAFICAKLKYPVWKTLLSSDRWGANVDKRKTACLFFRFRKSQWNNAHCIIFIFWPLLQWGPDSQNLTPCSHCWLTRQPPCFECARCNCRPFVLIVVWCIVNQTDRNGETMKHFHNCNKTFSQFSTPHCANLRQYSKRPKRGSAHDNAQILNLQLQPSVAVAMCRKICFPQFVYFNTRQNHI